MEFMVNIPDSPYYRFFSIEGHTRVWAIETKDHNIVYISEVREDVVKVLKKYFRKIEKYYYEKKV